MKLVPDQRDKNIMKTMQPIPGYMDADHDDWTKSLSTALERVG
jgi:hypothetical protein